MHTIHFGVAAAGIVWTHAKTQRPLKRQRCDLTAFLSRYVGSFTPAILSTEGAERDGPLQSSHMHRTAYPTKPSGEDTC